MSSKKKQNKIFKQLLIIGFGITSLSFILALFFNVTDYGITIASFCTTILMVLSSKKTNHKKIFGAYLIASVLGYVFSLIPIATSLNIAFVVLSSIFVMDFFSFQHVPALGMAISFVINNFKFSSYIFLFVSLFGLISLAFVLKYFLKDPETVWNFVEIENDKINWNL
jgi:hypothetical protein